MESIISEYLPYEPFRQLLAYTGAIIAGGAPLAAYLAEESMPSFTPSNLDIWIPRPFYPPNPMQRIITHLEQNGYRVVHRYDPDDCKEEDPDEHAVTEIVTLQRGENKIQLVQLQCDPKAHITDSFDFSPCITWWDARDEEIVTLYPADTKRRMMYLMHETDGPRHDQRLLKYIERGFRVMDAPPLHEIAMDPLEDLRAFEDSVAFDVINYEDVSAVEFLAASRWHILIRAAPTAPFHAYRREQLLEYLRDHSTEYRWGRIYTFPHKQSVFRDAIHYLAQSDFTVFDLRPSCTYQDQSLYSLYAYTVKGWGLGAHGAVCRAPSDEMLAAYEYFHVEQGEEL